MQSNFPSFIQALSQSGGGQFAWLYGHVSKSSGEVTNRKIQVGFSYMDLLGRAIVAAKPDRPGYHSGELSRLYQYRTSDRRIRSGAGCLCKAASRASTVTFRPGG